MDAVYDADYFIEKFSQIPDDQWTTGNYAMDGKCCALGHCGMRSGFGAGYEASELDSLFGRVFGKTLAVVNVNDGYCLEFNQPTPKARILAALQWIKEGRPSEH